MPSPRHFGRFAVLATVSALVVSACGTATPTGSSAASGAVPASGPSTSAATAPGGSPTPSGPIDPVAAARKELDLVHQLREEAGISARLGTGGEEALAALDAIEADFGRKILGDAAGLVEGKPAFTRTLADAPVVAQSAPHGQLASTGGIAAPRVAAGAVDISIFGDTGFTTSALMGLLAGVVRRAAESETGTLPRQEHFTDDSGGLHQEIDLNTTLSVTLGGGRASVDLQMSATDRFTKPDGTFVALYTSTSSGHFDVNACPDGGGIGEGTYSFKTKHELNDLTGSANAPSSAGRTTQGPFKLVNGDDAHLQRIEASLDSAADQGGPGAAGPSLVAQAMAQLVLAEVGQEAEKFWRSGACIKLTPSRASGTVDPEEKVDLGVTSKAKFGDTAEVKAPVVAKFEGKKSLDPHDTPNDYPPTFKFEAGPDEGDVGKIALEQTSRRGIGKLQVVYTVGGSLLLSVSSKGTPNLATVIKMTYQGTLKDLRLTRKDDAYEGKGQMKVTLTFKLSASGASCTGSKSKTYDVGVKAVPVADQPDQLDLSFDYTPGPSGLVTITCKTKEGTASMPAPSAGLLEVLPAPGDAKRVTIDATTQVKVPPSIAMSLTLRRDKK